MITPTINYLAVFVAAVVSIVLGAFWYSPVLFGKIWMQGSKMSEKDIKKGHVTKAYVITFITALVTAYILALFLDYLEASTISAAFIGAFWIWLGFYATTATGPILWENKPWTLYFLNVGYHLVALILMAVILTLWV